jgi:hypothetical protein
MRTYAAYSSRPSDLVNLMFIGSRDDIATAFEAAGWIEPQRFLHAYPQASAAVADEHGDSTAPNPMLVEDQKRRNVWQQSFNDLSSATTSGSGSSLQLEWPAGVDRPPMIDFAFWRRGTALTHKIAENVDDERDKVVNDLLFTSCASVLDTPERFEIPQFTRNATGDPMRTDARLAILEVNACTAPASSLQFTNAALPLHGSKVQRFARREILSLRSDVVRENIYWRSYEGVRWMITAYRGRGGRAQENDTRPLAKEEPKQGTDRSGHVPLVLLGQTEGLH